MGKKTKSLQVRGGRGIGDYHLTLAPPLTCGLTSCLRRERRQKNQLSVQPPQNTFVPFFPPSSLPSLPPVRQCIS